MTPHWRLCTFLVPAFFVAGQPTAGHAQAAGPAGGTEILSADVRAKVDARLLDATMQGGSTDFFIILNERADVSGAERFQAKAEKTRAVFESLRTTAERSQFALRRRLAALSVDHTHYYIANAILVRGGKRAQLLELARRSDTARIVPDEQVQIDLGWPAPKEAGRDGRFRGRAQHLDDVHAPQAWKLGFKGRGVVVGILDSGAFWKHPALIRRYRGTEENGKKASHAYNWWDASVRAKRCPKSAPCDTDGHGTHVTGLIVGNDGDGTRVGVAPRAKWISCRAFAGRSAPISQLVECLEFFLAPWNLQRRHPDPNRAPDVINHSWGISLDSPLLKTAFENLAAAGIHNVAATGNLGPFCSSITYPSRYGTVTSVGATAENNPDVIAFFSGKGPGDSKYGRQKPDVVAPGEFIWSANKDGGYIQMIGTSQSTPMVTGAVALLYSAAPRLIGNFKRTRSLLRQGAEPVPGVQDCGQSANKVPNFIFGWGFLDVLETVRGFQRTVERMATP